VVSNLANFGAFIDLGGADGLVHISQLAWSRVNHPSEVLKVGQEVEVQVLSVDKEKKKNRLVDQARRGRSLDDGGAAL
jgi:small subunit ribosomal protein S1